MAPKTLEPLPGDSFAEIARLTGDMVDPGGGGVVRQNTVRTRDGCFVLGFQLHLQICGCSLFPMIPIPSMCSDSNLTTGGLDSDFCSLHVCVPSNPERPNVLRTSTPKVMSRRRFSRHPLFQSDCDATTGHKPPPKVAI